MKSWIEFVFLLLPLLMWFPSCTNLEFNQTYDRMDDNYDLQTPGNIDPAGNNSFTFGVMGDTHSGGSGDDFYDEILTQMHTDGDAFVVVAGDLTNQGSESQFGSFKQSMIDNSYDNLFRVAIGNHDIYFGGWENYKKSIGHRSMYSFDADNVHFVMLDTANGLVGRRQLDWLKEDLETTTQPIKIVVAHFPAYNGTFSGIYRLNSDEEVNLLQNIFYENNVNYYISGHYHGYASKKIGRTTYIVTGGANNLLDPGEYKHFVRFTVSDNIITHEVIRY